MIRCNLFCIFFLWGLALGGCAPKSKDPSNNQPNSNSTSRTDEDYSRKVEPPFDQEVTVAPSPFCKIDDEAGPGVATSHTQARKLGIALSMEDFFSALSHPFLLASGIHSEKSALVQIPETLERIESRLVQAFSDLGVQATDSPPEKRLDFGLDLRDDISIIDAALIDISWIPARQSLRAELLPQALKEVETSLAAKCRAGRHIADELVLNSQEGGAFNCKFQWSEAQGLVCSVGSNRLRSVGSQSSWLEYAVDNAGPIGMAILGSGAIIGTISALESAAHIDNTTRCEEVATSADVIQSYKANCRALVSNFAALSQRVQTQLAAINSGTKVEDARALLERAAKPLPKSKDGSVDLTALSQEQAFQLAEAQIIYSISRSQTVSVSAESLNGYNTAVQNLRKTKNLALQWERFGRALAAPLSPIEANISAELIGEREILAFHKRFFELTASTIEASFNREKIPGVIRRLSQAASTAKELRLRYYKNPRIHRLEKGIQQLQRLLQ